MDASDLLRIWREQGYLVLRQVWDTDRTTRLYETCESAYRQWRAESTEDNQPGGFWYGSRGWVLLHLNHPGYHAGHAEGLRLLLEAIADPLAQKTLATIFRDDPLFMQANYYVDPAGEGWEGIWHRDCQFFSGGSEDTLRRLLVEEGEPPREVHMHIP
ncbi:MAG: hypothetical protein FJY97_19680, partial [candidate division Zixibacteria bacterium]|nr:hypothetical protein [candidate division Zixibacteria bacterium]